MKRSQLGTELTFALLARTCIMMQSLKTDLKLPLFTVTLTLLQFLAPLCLGERQQLSTKLADCHTQGEGAGRTEIPFEEQITAI